MAGVNRVQILGHLGQDPQLKTFDGGNQVANFSVATNETWKDKSGERQERVEWHRVQAWGKLAELCSKYLSKGRQAFVEGKLRTRSYEKDGDTRYVTEIVASNVTFIGSQGGPRDSGGGGPAYEPEPDQDGIPFASTAEPAPHQPGEGVG